MSTQFTTDPFLAATQGRRVRHTPVWFMRQAGRSLPEYRAVRGEGSILDAIKQPRLAADLTLQPVRRYGVDAAVLYSDIVVPAHAVGFGIDVTPGTGPVAQQPFRHNSDLSRLRPLEPELDTPYVIETVRLLAAELNVPLLAFAGAPFTVGSYLVEGRPSRDYMHTKALMTSDPTLWDALMRRLSEHAITSIRSQLDAGASAFQLFDSWAGALTIDEYRNHVLEYSRYVFDELRTSHPNAPGIHFGVGCDHLLEAMYAAGPCVIGLDWRSSIADVRMRLGANTIVQGNLNPELVLGEVDQALHGAEAVLADNAGHPGHIFNLGHGVQPSTNPDVLTAVVRYVHEQTATT
ncbi:MAG: uroporphyrinogen decarboxylase [Ilumatobacteraceae bacterium]